MKPTIQFLKTTLIGGVLIVLPIWVSVLLLVKTLAGLGAFLKPITAELPEGAQHPRILAFFVLLLGCFAIGLMVRTALGRRAVGIMEQRLLGKVPGYLVLRKLTVQITDSQNAEGFIPILAEIEEALVPAMLVERHADGRCTVFVPTAPTPALGSIYIMTPERVHLLDVPLIKLVACISKWGAGSAALLAAMRPPGETIAIPHSKGSPSA